MTPLDDWLATKPKCVRELAAEFPPGTQLDIHGVTNWVIGWTENDALVVSELDPNVDFDAAHEQRGYVCAEHFRVPTHGVGKP